MAGTPDDIHPRHPTPTSGAAETRAHATEPGESDPAGRTPGGRPRRRARAQSRARLRARRVLGWARGRRSRWNSWLSAAVAAGGGLVLLVVLVAFGFPPLRWLDGAAARLSGELAGSPVIGDVLLVLDLATGPWVLRAFGLAVLVVLHRRGEHRLAAWMLTADAVSWPLRQLAYAGASRLDGFGSPAAFATGHVLTSTLVIGALIVLGMRQPGQPLRRFASWVNGRLVLVLIALVQLGLGEQRVTGVVAAWLLGVLVLGVLALAFGLAQPVRRRSRTSRRKQLAVVLNPTKVQSAPDFRRQMERIAAEFGWEPPLWFDTTPNDAGVAMTRTAIDAGVDLVIAAGGDGTVRVVCAELAGSSVPLGIVPAGTGNLLVRNLGLPLDPESAIRVALTGRNRRIDLVRVRGDVVPGSGSGTPDDESAGADEETGAKGAAGKGAGEKAPDDAGASAEEPTASAEPAASGERAASTERAASRDTASRDGAPGDTTPDGEPALDERFAVMAGLGLDAAVVGDAPARLKAQMGWPAYVVSIARHLTYPAVRVEVSVDGRRPERRWARSVLVGNVGSLHAGLQLLPAARPDDGLLDVVVVSPRRATEWPALIWRMMRRSQAADDRLSAWRGRRVTVRAASPVPRQLDGDVLSVGRELSCEVEPGVLLIRVPAGLG